MKKLINNYLSILNRAIKDSHLEEDIETLAHALLKAWKENRTVFICGNGGSAANAIHLENDFTYGVACKNNDHGMNMTALTSNSSVLTCLANDISYDDIFSEQLKSKYRAGDILIVLSGSGNSRNIIKALKMAKKLNIESFAILGFDGGEAKNLSDYPIHLQVDDMQISEDFQLIVGHLCMKWLSEKRV